MDQAETIEPAFTQPPGSSFAGITVKDLKLPVPNVSTGRPFHKVCADQLKTAFGCSRVFIIASASLARNSDKVQRLIEAIGKDNVIGTRIGMASHSLWSEILDITSECREAKADAIVTLGAEASPTGPSSSLCLANDVTSSEQLRRLSVAGANRPALVKEPYIPLITIPTTLSGGEYFSLAGGTDDATQQKHGFLHSGMGSRLIILDPELCTLTPLQHWLSTGFRGVDHCVEALCCLSATPTSDDAAERALRLLVPGLLRCKKDAADVEARFSCQLAVRFAMENVWAGIPMGGSHAIGHQLGPLGVPHGITSCILCPAVMKYNAQHGSGNAAIASRQQRIRDILWSGSDVASVFREAGLPSSADLGDLLSAIVCALGMPQTLKEVNVSRDAIPALSERALKDFWAPTNPVPLVQSEQVAEILTAVAG
ncbi:hypothetical protein HIM_01922 [Hirsutella minnesotensis 3608]|nr:hypothetical protein HIM_01922 [Hirsutella minnesotensis 3608]